MSMIQVLLLWLRSYDYNADPGLRPRSMFMTQVLCVWTRSMAMIQVLWLTQGPCLWSRSSGFDLGSCLWLGFRSMTQIHVYDPGSMSMCTDVYWSWPPAFRPVLHGCTRSSPEIDLGNRRKSSNGNLPVKIVYERISLTLQRSPNYDPCKRDDHR